MADRLAGHRRLRLRTAASGADADPGAPARNERPGQPADGQDGILTDCNLVPTLRVDKAPAMCAWMIRGHAAERPDVRSHAERENETVSFFSWSQLHEHRRRDNITVS